MAEISVIVPVYKVESYLHRCVDSILRQTDPDFELILVDDGSPDGCPRICDEYAEKDPRVRVIHQENRGLSGARNAGIDLVMEEKISRWVTFVDSDDWIHPRMLELLRRAAVEAGTSVAVCGYEETEGADPGIPEDQLAGESWPVREFYLRHTVNATTAWGKLFARECLEGIRYPQGKLHEDEFTTYRVLFSQERLAFVPAPLYAYYFNPASITKSSWKPQRMDVFEALEQQIAFFRQRGDSPLADDCLHRYLRNAYGQIQELRSTECPENYSGEEQLLRTRTRELLKECYRRGCICFETDFSLLTEFYPVRTRLHLYWLAALRRLKGEKHG